eukprot:PhM_4_TR12517/c0_g1_i1/m.14192
MGCCASSASPSSSVLGSPSSKQSRGGATKIIKNADSAHEGGFSTLLHPAPPPSSSSSHSKRNNSTASSSLSSSPSPRALRRAASNVSSSSSSTSLSSGSKTATMMMATATGRRQHKTISPSPIPSPRRNESLPELVIEHHPLPSPSVSALTSADSTATPSAMALDVRMMSPLPHTPSPSNKRSSPSSGRKNSSGSNGSNNSLGGALPQLKHDHDPYAAMFSPTAGGVVGSFAAVGLNSSLRRSSIIMARPGGDKGKDRSAPPPVIDVVQIAKAHNRGTVKTGKREGEPRRASLESPSKKTSNNNNNLNKISYCSPFGPSTSLSSSLCMILNSGHRHVDNDGKVWWSASDSLLRSVSEEEHEVCGQEGEREEEPLNGDIILKEGNDYDYDDGDGQGEVEEKRKHCLNPLTVPQISVGKC